MRVQRLTTVAKILITVGACGFFIANWFPIAYANSSEATSLPIYVNMNSLTFLIPPALIRGPFIEALPLFYTATLSFGVVYVFFIVVRPMLWNIGLFLSWIVISSVLESVLMLKPFSTTPASATSNFQYSGEIGLGAIIFLGAIICLMLGTLYLLMLAMLKRLTLSEQPHKPSPRIVQQRLLFWSLCSLFWSMCYMIPFWATTQCKGIIFMDSPCYGRIDPFDIWSSVLTPIHSFVQPDIFVYSLNMLLVLWSNIGVWSLVRQNPRMLQYSILVWQTVTSILTIGAVWGIASLFGTIDHSVGKIWVMMPGMPLAILGIILTWIAAILTIRAITRSVEENSDKNILSVKYGMSTFRKILSVQLNSLPIIPVRKSRSISHDTE